jgi:hypothetical protein
MTADVELAKVWLARGRIDNAAREMFSRAELLTMAARNGDELRKWAEVERSQGHGIRAEILAALAGARTKWTWT